MCVLVEANSNLNLLIKIPIGHVVIKTNVFNASILAHDLQNLLLFLGRKQILTVMHSIVRPIPATE